MKQYDKLIRDNIPQIIQASGKTCQTRVLDQEEYVAKLTEKLAEECAEFAQSGEVEELADIMEVVLALAKTKGCAPQQLEQIRLQKATKNGGFEKRLLLLWTDTQK